MKIKKLIHLFFIIILFSKYCFSQNVNIETDLLALIKPFNGKVGVAITNLKTNEKININSKKKYPMQSVYKFHLALAVFDQIDKGKLKLDQKMNLKKADLLPDTHSPLRDKYPDGKADISLKEIIENTVALSDNNGCDLQFRLMGGCKNVDKFIKKYIGQGINIAFTEEEMHKDKQAQYINYATPEAMNQLLVKFYKNKILSKTSTEILWKIMTETNTGPNRLRGNLPKNTIFGHKTGWSGTDEKGFTRAINDTGIVILPNGDAFAITVFISDTYEKTEKSDELAAKICKLAYDHFNK